MSRASHSLLAVLFSLVFASCATSPNPRPTALGLRATEGGPFDPKNGFYVGANLGSVTLTGDFDGDSALTDGSDVIVIPDTDAGGGASLEFGYRGDRTSVGGVFTGSEHDGSVLGVSGFDVELGSFTIDTRIFFRPQERLQPFVLVGGGLVTATIEDGSSNGTETGDGELLGLLLDVGGGTQYFINEHLAVNAQGVLRLMTFGYAEGVDADGSIDDDLNAVSFAVMVGMALTF